MCDCIRNVNRQLRDSGAQLMTLTPRHHDTDALLLSPRVVVRTFNTDPSFYTPPVAVATHCPFCGTKYEN